MGDSAPYTREMCRPAVCWTEEEKPDVTGKETIAETEGRLLRLGVPPAAVERHIAELRQARRITRRQLVRVQGRRALGMGDKDDSTSLASPRLIARPAPTSLPSRRLILPPSPRLDSGRQTSACNQAAKAKIFPSAPTRAASEARAQAVVLTASPR